MKKHLMVKNYSSTYGFKLLKVNKKYSMVRVVNDVVQGFQIDEYRRCGRKATYIKYDIYPLCNNESNYYNGIFAKLDANVQMDIPIFDTYLTDEKICEIIQSVVFPFLKRYDSCKSYYGYLNKMLRLDECGIEEVFFALKNNDIYNAICMINERIAQCDDAYESCLDTMDEESLNHKLMMCSERKEKLKLMLNGIVSYTPDELDKILLENEKIGIKFIDDHLV